MRKPLIAILGLLTILMLSAPALAENLSSSDAKHPGVSLEAWKNSTQAEKYAFLLGLMSMVEMEKTWQGEHPLPFKQSLIPSWSAGLADLSFEQISATVDSYIVANPGNMKRQVLEVLWFQLVQPKLTTSLGK